MSPILASLLAGGAFVACVRWVHAEVRCITLTRELAESHEDWKHTCGLLKRELEKVGRR